MSDPMALRSVGQHGSLRFNSRVIVLLHSDQAGTNCCGRATRAAASNTLLFGYPSGARGISGALVLGGVAYGAVDRERVLGPHAKLVAVGLGHDGRSSVAKELHSRGIKGRLEIWLQGEAHDRVKIRPKREADVCATHPVACDLHMSCRLP